MRGPLLESSALLELPKEDKSYGIERNERGQCLAVTVVVDPEDEPQYEKDNGPHFLLLPLNKVIVETAGNGKLAVPVVTGLPALYPRLYKSVAVGGGRPSIFIPVRETVELARQPGPVSLDSDGSVGFSGFLNQYDEESIEYFFRKNWNKLTSSRSISLNFGDCRGFDSVAAVLIFRYIRRLEADGIRVEFSNLSSDGAEFFDSFRQNEPRTEKRKPRHGFRQHFEDVGEHVLDFVRTVRGLVDFALETLTVLFHTICRPVSVRWPLVFYYMEQTGVKAIPIIMVLCWLLGSILGYQAGYQMRNFGAELYMPALIAYSITWEIGPMLAAVLVAGRSGSAFAAEIGTMKVRQEVDALSVMGFNVFSYLVTPKMIALMCVMPILVLLANFSGLLGGLLAGGVFLGMPASIYLAELGKALIPMDIYWGMLKGILYAVIISTTGCYMGMRVRGGAAAVGRATTSAVVVSIFLVIVSDALLSILFIHIRPGLSM